MHRLKSRFAAMTLISLVVMSLGVALPDAASAAAPRSFPGCPILRQGATGACVKHLQSDLDTIKAAYKLPISGVFGAQTAAAVRDFQRQYRFTVTGVVDFVTAGALDRFAAGARSLSRSSRPATPSTPSSPNTALPGGQNNAGLIIDKLQQQTICKWAGSMLKVAGVEDGPAAIAAGNLFSKEYVSVCTGDLKGLKSETAQNLIDAGVEYAQERGLDAVFKNQIAQILSGVGSNSETVVEVSAAAWNNFILSLIQRLKAQQVNCEEGSKFPPPISCSVQTLTNHLLGLLRK